MRISAVFALVAAAAVAWLVIAALRRTPLARRLADRPNERSLHERPTPRIGGLGVIAGALPIAALFAPAALVPAIACAAFLAIVSALDDVRSLPIEVRLPAHGAAALVAVLAMAAPWTAPTATDLALALLAVVALVWSANLFNFMDGSDGLAGAMAIVGFGALAIAAHEARSDGLAMACAACAAASAGFLAHNFPPARVFLGDCGSVPLGFLAAAFGAYGALESTWPWWFPVLAFSPFVVDATVTLLRRIARGEHFWRAHRDHAYQRLVLAGWSKVRLLAWECVAMLAAAASALAALGAGEPARLGILIGWSIAYVLILLAIERIAGVSVSS